MHLLSKWTAAFLVLSFGAALLPAQEKSDATFRSDTRLVLLHATVVDKNGKIVGDLPKEAFTILENGIEQPIKIFRREDVPVSMGLIVDNSGSMRDKRQQVATAALRLVKESNPQDEIFIVNFNDEAFLDQPFTSAVKKLEEALTRIDSRGGTAMRDAVSMSIDYVKEKGKRDKKVLLVVTDGDDNTSSGANTIEKLIEKAHLSEVLIYCIGLLNEEERGKAKRAQRAMRALSEASGGASYFPKAVADIDALSSQVAHEIRNQYILAYSPSEQALDGTFRRVQVQAKGAGRPVVRTRSGYYATKDQKSSQTPTPGQANSLR